MTDGPSAVAEAATDAPAPRSVSEKAADFENYLFEGEEEDSTEEQPETDDGEELDLSEEEQDGEEDEPEAAIDAPASLNAEEKKVFAQLPTEAQQAWAASETRRNAQVQEATTKAANAQREAEAKAASANAEAKALFSQQLDQFVRAFEPTAPDPNLAYQNPAQYIAEKAQYDAIMAQHNELVQYVRGIQTEASMEAEQAFIAQRDRELMSIPEVANPETRQGFIDRVFEAAEALGYDRETIGKNANSSDIIAISKAAEWKAKADRFDKAMSRQMQKVRAAKGKTLRPNAAPQAPSRAARSDQAWQKVKAAGSNKSARDAAAAEWLESAGYL